MARVGQLIRAAAAIAAAALAVASSAAERTVPFSDTEDASLGSVTVGDSRLHPIGRLNLRNGDYARGSYDDDRSGLGRLPAHGEVGLVYELDRGPGGEATWWLEAHSSNGFHSPAVTESTSPRAWYESNNLVGLVAAPMTGLRAALTYAIKASPNGVSATTHEASFAASYESKHGFGWLHPSVAATFRPRGGHGSYTQIGVEPEFDFGDGESAPTVSLPVLAGVGWGGFYERGTGSVAFASAGVAYVHSFELGGSHMSLRAEVSALIRDRTLARLDATMANQATIVPIGQITLTAAY